MPGAGRVKVNNNLKVNNFQVITPQKTSFLVAELHNVFVFQKITDLLKSCIC